ncbi:hypothetical protein [Stenotrophomonas maltophilia]|uniref:PD-(D/E)XK nuclease domain-containing protein n=1 Tax=Stenotrophomonas maltophilia TaxID=40324 RepID=UPI000AA28740|nr:hypothetical protein [Stenotrophomonas maltophilia]
MNLEPTINYLTQFFHSHREDYFEMMRDAGSYSYPPKFQGESEVIQGIRNIVHNIQDNYWDISIPKGYASPSLLLGALTGLRDMADKQLAEVDRIINELEVPWYDEISYAHKINLEVREAIDHGLSLSRDAVAVCSQPLERLKRLATRLPMVAAQLLHRRNQDGMPRPTLAISDEYDVQDLFHSILKLEFDDIRAEEWCPSYAGSSKRLDLLIKEASIVVEVKKTRAGLGQKQVGEQLIIDIANYRNHRDCKHLFCLVWDSSKMISNPIGLQSDLESSNPGFVTVSIVG